MCKNNVSAHTQFDDTLVILAFEWSLFYCKKKRV